MPPSNLPLRHQVGQLFIIGFEGTDIAPSTATVLRTLQPGGTILFARNIETAQQTHALNAAVFASQQTRPFLCIDLEGGTVDRLRKAVAHAPDVASVAITGRKTVFAQHGQLLGEECRALGFNVDFAPVLDLDTEASKPVLTSRTAASDGKKVALFAEHFLRGLSKAKVLGCGKHFPGLGSAQLDTHRSTAVIDKPFKRLWDEDLRPYRELHRRLPFIMIGHAVYPAVTKRPTPASRSAIWIRDILRQRIGYRGIVLSDDLEMGAALASTPIEEVALETLRAGADGLLICRQEELIWRAYEAVLRHAEKDRRFAEKVRRSCARILAQKAASPGVAKLAKSPDAAIVEKLRSRMHAFRTEVVGDLPL